MQNATLVEPLVKETGQTEAEAMFARILDKAGIVDLTSLSRTWNSTSWFFGTTTEPGGGVLCCHVAALQGAGSRAGVMCNG